MDEQQTSQPQNSSTAAHKESPLMQLEHWLADINKKAPQIPANGKEAIVKIAPWITLIVLVISLPFILALFGLTAILSPLAFMGGYHMGASFIIGWVISFATFILEAIALPGLFHRKRRSWELIFYGSLLSVLSGVISLSITGILFSILGLYLLFQVREYYK